MMSSSSTVTTKASVVPVSRVDGYASTGVTTHGVSTRGGGGSSTRGGKGSGGGRSTQSNAAGGGGGPVDKDLQVRM